MRCSEATRQLQLYIDDRLSLDQVRTLEVHIAACANCREELCLLEEGISSLRILKLVAEPSDLTQRIMERVAVTPQRRLPDLAPLKPSLQELLLGVFLATLTTLGVILAQPSIRAALPFANGHDAISLFFINSLHQLLSLDFSALIWVFWIFGTLLGVAITLLLVGEDVRAQWYKAMMDRLPVR